MTSPLKVWREKNGHLLRLRLDRPKANIVDAEMIAAISAAIQEAEGERQLLGVLLDHSGPHFSFGASIEEHFPDKCAAMLTALHGLIKRMLGLPLPILVAVRGQCLGGGLEVALAGSMIFAAPDAMLGQPEIKIAMFAPAASCLLPDRIGQAAAEDILVSGRSLTAEEALRIGLIRQVADNPEQAALDYFDAHLAKLSASSLRIASRAAKEEYAERVGRRLDAVERLCNEELMKTADAVEGLVSFQEKRKPVWKHA
jgi:cyclohexa-1,5-dienecarbonyl-CoA hydratase